MFLCSCLHPRDKGQITLSLSVKSHLGSFHFDIDMINLQLFIHIKVLFADSDMVSRK